MANNINDSAQQRIIPLTAGKPEAAVGKQSMQELLQSYLFPVVMIIVAIFMLFVVLLPLLDSVSRNMGEVGELTSDYQDYETVLAQRKNLQQVGTEQLELLEVVNRIIPEQETAVAGFATRIQEKALDNGVDLSESITGELVVNAPGAEQPVQLVELPAKFVLRGSLAAMKSFLTDIYSGSDFLIIRSMSLRQQLTINPITGEQDTSNSDNWIMDLQLVKYQFRPQTTGANDAQTAFFTVPDGAKPAATVVSFIKKYYLGQEGD